ncbi:MAG TPA: alpha/beta fold hydrolase [Gaiellaceae bacterium]|nr:alpha/beta fold hydrolase [Gaiellaceae bacterium]
METQVRTALVGGRRCRWREAGSGPPLVLVHGLAGSWRWWRPVLPMLAAERTVHLVDLPGFGRLPGVRPFDPDASVEWLARWSEAAEIGPADLVGHSLGGLLCARLAARHPETVRRLVLVAPAGLPGRTAVRSTAPLLRVLFASRPRFLALLASDAARSGPVTIGTAARALLAADARSDLAAVRTRTLVLAGARDHLVPLAHAQELAQALPDGRVRVLDAGHVPMVDRPAELSRELLEFLAEP